MSNRKAKMRTNAVWLIERKDGTLYRGSAHAYAEKPWIATDEKASLFIRAEAVREIAKNIRHFVDAWPLRYYSNPNKREEGIVDGFERAAEELRPFADVLESLLADPPREEGRK